MGPKKGVPSLAAARLQHWAVCLSTYQYNIRFKPTGEHANADGLSRLPLPITERDVKHHATNTISAFNQTQIDTLPPTASQIAKATRQDKLLSNVLHYTKVGWSQSNREPEALKPYFHRQNEILVERGCILWGCRVIIPLKHQTKILNELHCDHPGCTRMKSVARSFVWWPQMVWISKMLQNPALHANKTNLLHHQLHYTPGYGQPNHGNGYTSIMPAHSWGNHSS